MRFYFHIRDGEHREIDTIGLEFPSLEHAVLDARIAAREILAEMLVANETVNAPCFEIADESGRILATIPYLSGLRLN